MLRSGDSCRACCCFLGRWRVPELACAWLPWSCHGSGCRWCSRRGYLEAHKLVSFRETRPYAARTVQEPADQSAVLWGCWNDKSKFYSWCWLCCAALALCVSSQAVGEILYSCVIRAAGRPYMAFHEAPRLWRSLDPLPCFSRSWGNKKSQPYPNKSCDGEGLELL